MAAPLKKVPACGPEAPHKTEPDLRPVEGPEADEELATLAKALGHAARVHILRLLVRRDAEYAQAFYQRIREVTRDSLFWDPQSK